MLSGVRVVDLSSDIAASYAAKLFATYGADVIKVEPPVGDPTRRLPPTIGDGPDDGVLFAYLNTGKRSVVVDIDDASQRARLRELLSTADVVFDSSTPGSLAARALLPHALADEHPRMVVCSITPFGQDGPRAGWQATSLTAFAAGGQMALCGAPEGPPLKTAGHQAYYQSGLHGFAASLMALYAARRSGIGDYLDISIQEVQASTLEHAGPSAMVRGADTPRAGNAARSTWAIYPCRDGWVGVASLLGQLPAIYECIGHPELTDGLDGGFGDAEHDALAGALILEWTSARTAAEIYEASGRHRAPFSLIPTPGELINWPHLVESGFWQYVDHPTLGRHVLPAGPIEMEDGRGSERRAPLLGEHTDEVLSDLAPAPPAEVPPTWPDEGLPGPLTGIRVLDLTQVWAGPYGTRFLGDMGAELIKIEGPANPDVLRSLGTDLEHPRWYNCCPYFNEYNRNKMSLTLDLALPEGLALFRELVRDADVVVENWASGVADRLGIGWEALRTINPRLVFVSSPGFGHRGADAQRIGYGPTIEQMGGLVALQGYEGGPPHKSGISYGDPVAGTVAAAAVALGLIRRELTGEGSYSVVAQRDAVIGLVGEYMVAESIGSALPARTGNTDLVYAPHNVYRARDDEGRHQEDFQGNVIAEFSDTWIAIAVGSDEQWDALRTVLRDPRLDDARFDTADGRRRARKPIDTVIADWARGLDPLEAAELLQSVGVPASPVLSPLALTRDEHLHARGFFTQYEHPETGTQMTTRSPWRLARRPFKLERPAPCFGEHNELLLGGLLSLDGEQIEHLRRVRVIAESPLSR